MDSDGASIFVGTRIREADLYGRLIDEGFFTSLVIMPALLREPGTDGPDDPASPCGRNDGRRTSSSGSGARSWGRAPGSSDQQNPLSGEGAAFPISEIEACFDPVRFVGQVPPESRVCVGIDPAVSGFTDGVVLAVDAGTRMRYVIDVWNKRDLTGDGEDRHQGLIEFIAGLCAKYRAEVVAIEENSFQTLITSSLTLRKKLDELGVRRLPIRSMRAENDDLDIAQLAAVFSHRLVSIPTAGDSKARTAEFIRQFCVWRPSDRKLTKDIVKAFQFADKAARSIINRYTEAPQPVCTNRRWEPPPYLRKQTGYYLNDPRSGRPCTMTSS